MTEFEMASTLAGHFTLIGTALMNYFTILTAFLVVGYVAAHRLTLSMSLFVTVLFVVSSLFFAANIVGIYTATRGLMVEMNAFYTAGKGLNWAPAARAQPSVADYFSYVALIIMVGGIVGSVYFFSKAAGKT